MKRFVELYGRLRDAGLGPGIELEIPEGAAAAEALAALRRALGTRATLLDGAVLATENAALRPQDPVPLDGRLAALPPVCGG